METEQRMDGFAEANLLLTSALEQLDDIIKNGNNRGGAANSIKNYRAAGNKVNNSTTFLSTRQKMDDHLDDLDNGNADDERSSKDVTTRHWVASDWKHRTDIGSDGSSGVESPPSDLPTSSSSLFNPPRIYQDFVKAIDDHSITEKPDLETRLKIMQWVAGNTSPSPSMSTVSCPEYPELQDKLHRLAMARDSLQLQVSVLSEQVGAQKEKIRDLEALLALKRNNLTSTEELLQDKYHRIDDCKELESKKMDLLAEVSSLKLKFVTLEREKNETEKKLRLSQNEMDHVNQSMHGMVVQQQLHHTNGGGYMAPLREHRNEKQDEEMAQLRTAVQRLIADNEQKSHQINSLRNALDEQMRSRSQQDDFYATQRWSSGTDNNPSAGNFDVNAQIRRILMEETPSDLMSHSTSFPVSLSSTNSIGKTPRSTVQSSSSYTSSLSTASPQHSWSNAGTPRHHLHPKTNSPIGGPMNQYRSPSSPAARQLAAELDELRRMGAEVSIPGHSYSTASLPRGVGKASSTLALPSKKLSLASGTSAGELLGSSMSSIAGGNGGHPPTKRNYRAQMNRWINEKLRRNKRARSAPNLVESDDEIARSGSCTARSMNNATSHQNLQPKNLSRDRTRSSLRNIFSKFTRSTSQDQSNSFRRGSTARSTSTARLGSTSNLGGVARRPPLSQFVDWRSEQLAEWISEIGYPQYMTEVGKNVRSGRHFLNMNLNEYESVLNIKNPVHRKRVAILLRRIEDDIVEPANKWDVHMTLRWLDDIGLPQYKDIFLENVVDGPLLLALTAGDVVEMRINNAHHYATLARSIQFLKLTDFKFDVMEKRMDPNVIDRYPCPDLVVRWTHQATCEWLRKIDLAEFTPNLLCAGVPGALMIYEPTFTAESLAEILQMPAHKTLLRRHLTSHFNQLVGQKIIADKRDFLASGNYPQVSPAIKVKIVRKGFSLTRKKAKNEICMEPDELLCPSSLNHKYPTVSAETSSLESSNV